MASRLTIATLLLLHGCAAVAAGAQADRRALRGVTPCERRRWHIDIENTDRPGCSNSFKVPSSWLLPGSSKLFYDTFEACCSELFEGRKCHLTDYCKQAEEPAQVVTDPDPDDDDECDAPVWHFDVDTKEGCTNSGRYPPAWRDPRVASDFLFASAETCCERFVKAGAPCTRHDVCRGRRGLRRERTAEGATD